MTGGFRPPTGHVFRLERKRGPQWYAKYRLPDGRQVQTRLGPAWTEGGRPPAGYFTKRLAEDWQRRTLDGRARDAAGHGPERGDVRGPRRRVPPLYRRGPVPQVVDG